MYALASLRCLGVRWRLGIAKRNRNRKFAQTTASDRSSWLGPTTRWSHSSWNRYWCFLVQLWLDCKSNLHCKSTSVQRFACVRIWANTRWPSHNGQHWLKRLQIDFNQPSQHRHWHERLLHGDALQESPTDNNWAVQRVCRCWLPEQWSDCGALPFS